MRNYYAAVPGDSIDGTRYPWGWETAQYNDATVLASYSDSLSWTKGKHGFKGGGELRFGHSLGYDAGISPTAIPRAVGGDTNFAPILPGAISTTNMPGLAGTTGAGNNARMRSLLSFLAGSVSAKEASGWPSIAIPSRSFPRAST